MKDIEAAQEAYSNNELNEEYDTEREALLPESVANLSDKVSSPATSSSPGSCSRRQFGGVHIGAAFMAGVLACFLAQFAICGTSCFRGTLRTNSSDERVDLMASPDAGSTQVHKFPPASPTNAFPSLFPTDVGYPGGTPTGAEAGVVATAPSYPIHSGAAQLLVPQTLGGTKKGKHKGNQSREFNLFEKWGNLSPWYTIEKGRFGVGSGPETPDTCRVTGLHFLHRHGARYPTAWGGYYSQSKE